jgi:CRISPR-associated endonuclease/helicase Cas3
MDNEHEIYKDDIRLDINISKEKYREMLKNKDFEAYYNLILALIERENNKQKKEGIHNFYRILKLLDYENVEKHMRLITENTIQVFIPYEIKDKQGKILYDGYKIWDKLKQINEDCSLSYAQKKVELKNLAEEINLFTYNVYLDEIPNAEYINGIYYIADGEKYIEDSQFDRKSFMKEYK